MKNQSEKKLSKKPYVKADLSPYLNMALEIISEKLGNTKSGIVNTALEYYFKNQFPEILPKSEAELMMKVKENLDIEKYEKEYLHNNSVIESIISYEEGIKESREKIKLIKGKIIPLEQKILDEQYDDQDDKKMLEEKIQKLKEEKKVLLSDIKDNERLIMESKKRRASLRPYLPVSIL